MYLCYLAHSIKPSSSVAYANGITCIPYDNTTAELDAKDYSEVWVQLPPHPTDLGNISKLLEPVRAKGAEIYIRETIHKKTAKKPLGVESLVVVSRMHEAARHCLLMTDVIA